MTAKVSENVLYDSAKKEIREVVKFKLGRTFSIRWECERFGWHPKNLRPFAQMTLLVAWPLSYRKNLHLRHRVFIAFFSLAESSVKQQKQCVDSSNLPLPCTEETSCSLLSFQIFPNSFVCRRGLYLRESYVLPPIPMLYNTPCRLLRVSNANFYGWFIFGKKSPDIN